MSERSEPDAGCFLFILMGLSCLFNLRIFLGTATIFAIFGVFYLYYRLMRALAIRFGDESETPAFVFFGVVAIVVIAVAGPAILSGIIKVFTWRGGLLVAIIFGLVVLAGVLWVVFAIVQGVSVNRPSSTDVASTSAPRLLWNRVGNEVAIVGLKGEVAELRLPHTIDGTPVTAISAGAWNHGRPTGAFADSDALTTVVLPSSMTRVGDYAIKGCDYLTTVVFPKGLHEIGYGAFYGCGNLTRVQLPEGLQTLHGGAFFKCGSLERVRVRGGVTVVEKKTFAGCVALRFVELEEGVERLMDSAFRSCVNLERVILPTTLKTLDSGVFQGCASLKAVELHEGLERIGADAFPPTTRFYARPNSWGERWAQSSGRPLTLANKSRLN